MPCSHRILQLGSILESLKELRAPLEGLSWRGYDLNVYYLDAPMADATSEGKAYTCHQVGKAGF